MEGYPRYEASDRGHSNPAYDDFPEPDSQGPPSHEEPEGRNSAKVRVSHGGKPIDEKCNGALGKDGLGKQSKGKSKGQKDKSKCPVGYCALVARHPRRAFALALCVHLLLLLITLILLLAGYDILPTNFTEVPLNLLDDEQYLRAAAWRYRNQEASIHERLVTGDVVNERSIKQSQIQLNYDLQKSGGNVLTTENLEKIREAESRILSMPGFDDFCLLSETGVACEPPVSVLRLFDGTYSFIDSRLYNPNFVNVSNTLIAAAEHSVTSAILDFHLGKNSVIRTVTQPLAYSDITRSLIYLGLPLDGYDNTEDNSTEQLQRIKDFEIGPLRDKLYELGSSGVGEMRFTFISATLYIEDTLRQVILDLCLAIGSMIFIFLFMWLQTGSLFVSTFALLSIITSFCGANMLYRIVFGYRYFGIFHVLSVFIILGIGADDIFVFFDTWKYTAHGGYGSLEERFSAAYRRAAIAMLVTSLTTMIAFFASALSPLLAVSSFGLFSGLLVFVNYISVVTYFPTVVMLYHVKWENKVLPCCTPCCKQKVEDGNSVQEEQGDRKGPKSKNPIVRFFAGPYFKFVTHQIIRWVILVVYAVILLVFIYFATKLSPDEEGVKLWRENTNHGRAKAQQSDAFKPSMEDDVVKVYMVWGLREQDRSQCDPHQIDTACPGTTVWDNGFDLNPAPAQTALRDFCARLRSLSGEEEEKLMVRRDSVTGQLQVQCFIEAMEDYLQGPIPGFKLPAKQDKVLSLMEDYPHFYGNTRDIPETFYRYFEVGLSFWLSNGYQGHLTYDYEAFGHKVGEASDPRDTNPVGNTGYYYGTHLRYAAIAVNTSLPYGNIGYEQGLPIMDNWEDFFSKAVSEMPPSLSGGFQCTPEDPEDSAVSNIWHWLKVQKTLARSAVVGIVIGICLACPILILATHNVITGLLATFIIICITVTVVGLIPMAGWKLGVLESLNLSLVVGLAVDYVVHLAEAYSAASASDRKGRVREMLERVGISVLSGAVTTLGASLFMLFAKILFFMQFGIFMFCTIGFSLLYALGLFVTLLALIGPQGETGSTRPILSAIKNFFIRRKKTDVDCETCDGRGFHAYT